MKKKVSVIIPAYNNQRDIVRLLKSLKNQSYSNIEIIVVDDGSRNSIEEYCHDHLQLDKKFVFKKKINGGVSSARNTGLSVSEGDYICFIDADDEVSANYIEELVKHAGKGIISVARIITKKEENQNELIYEKRKIENCVEFVMKNWSVCGKLYYKEDVQGLCFDENLSIGEDLEYNCKLLLSRKMKIARSEDAVYYYHYNANSAMHSCYFTGYLNGLNMEVVCYNLLREARIIKKPYYLIGNGAYQMMTRFFELEEKIIESNIDDYYKAKKVISRYWKEIFVFGEIETKKKKLIFLSYYFPRILLKYKRTGQKACR